MSKARFKNVFQKKALSEPAAPALSQETVDDSLADSQRPTQTQTDSQSSAPAAPSATEPRTKRVARAPRVPLRQHKPYKPGERAAREIRFYQRTTHKMMPRAAMVRMTRAAVQKIAQKPMFIEKSAVDVIHEACETYLAELLEESALCSGHARRATTNDKDLRLVLAIRGMDEPPPPRRPGLAFSGGGLFPMPAAAAPPTPPTPPTTTFGPALTTEDKQK